MINKRLRNGYRTFSLNSSLLKRFDKVCETNKIRKSDVVNSLIAEWLKIEHPQDIYDKLRFKQMRINSLMEEIKRLKKIISSFP
jgi:hypothetical protein